MFKILSIFSMLAMPFSCHSSWYASASGGGFYNGISEYQHAFTDFDKTGSRGSFGVGYDFEDLKVRTEASFSMHQNHLTQREDLMDPVPDRLSKIYTFTAGVNVYYDIPYVVKNFSPYVGFGSKLYMVKKKWDFHFQDDTYKNEIKMVKIICNPIFGLQYSINGNWKIFSEYMFSGSVNGEIKNQCLDFGLRYRL